MKGYWISRVTVNDPERYKDYLAAGGVAFAKFGGRFLARGGRHENLEGAGRARNIVIEFDDFETALACYRSDEYQVAQKIREECADADLVIVEGTA
ncbi:MAG TPA: DUF1330 domain-containing protein [Hyphomicrobiales bacterium]|nr:DUF1330 domain-containing protein [Rhodobiaceae bacterium]HXK53246.1 DUF1330 domain-containing protein [Hyphomicrobiales bacterium]